MPLIFLAERLRALIGRSPRTEFSIYTRDTNFTGYADHIGCFKFIGFERGRAPGEAAGGKSYSPITVFEIGAIIEEAAGSPVGPVVSRKAAHLAEVLSQKNSGALFDLFEYTIREVMRNSVEHSRGARLVCLAQHWPAKGEAEIVISDDGVGVAETLYDNEYIECQSNRDGLKFALLPGISGVSREERAKQDNRWGNSGFGLYTTSRVCSEAGLFRILSGGNSLTLARSVQTEHPWSFNGTCVQMRFDVSTASKSIERIADIVAEGEAEQIQLLRTFPISASVASKMLASHFSKDEFI